MGRATRSYQAGGRDRENLRRNRFGYSKVGADGGDACVEISGEAIFVVLALGHAFALSLPKRPRVLAVTDLVIGRLPHAIKDGVLGLTIGIRVDLCGCHERGRLRSATRGPYVPIAECEDFCVRLGREDQTEADRSRGAGTTALDRA